MKRIAADAAARERVLPRDRDIAERTPGLSESVHLSHLRFFFVLIIYAFSAFVNFGNKISALSFRKRPADKKLHI